MDDLKPTQTLKSDRNGDSNSFSHAAAYEDRTTMEVNDVLKRYECAICINCMNEPVQTRCGHRYCRCCLAEWMENKSQICPTCQSPLTPNDIFPDNYIRREIEQFKIKCPNFPAGCSLVASSIEIDRHLPTCAYGGQHEKSEKCPFASVKCDFVGRLNTNAIEQHMKEDMVHHLQLMLAVLKQLELASWNPQKSNDSNADALKASFQRIVVLEQITREQEAKIETQQKQLLSMHQLDPRYSNGTIVWEIHDFEKLVEKLRADSTIYETSRECYTSAHGYKFCARLNIPPNRGNLLSLHVHLMKSDNDFHLDWPFKGRIKLCIVHPSDISQSQHDTIMTKPDIQAFHRPREHISTRGFGFVEYVNIADITARGFCQNDCLVIKIQINIV